jgi:uroporphyrinogen decarboxylase
MSLRFDEGAGPRFDDPIRTRADARRLRVCEPETDLAYTLDAIRITRRELAPQTSVIGFAGAPWTLAAYMIGGAGASAVDVAIDALSADPTFMLNLLDRLAGEIGRFLVAQVEAGADVIQLFESSAGALTPEQYRTFALPALAKAASIARGAGAPLIVFPHGAPWALEDVGRATNADVIGADWRIAATDARAVADRLDIAVQGNLDPGVLLTTPQEVRRRTQQMLRDFAGPGHIANLGHGITPKVPVENARAFVDAVRDWRADL